MTLTLFLEGKKTKSKVVLDTAVKLTWLCCSNSYFMKLPLK